jgi:hypothetical protein
MKLIKWIKSLFKKEDAPKAKLVRRNQRNFDLVEASTQIERGKTHMIMSKGKTYRVKELG